MKSYNELRKETTQNMHKEGKMQTYLWTKTLLLEKISEVRNDLDFSKLSLKNLRDISLVFCDEIYNVKYYSFSKENILSLTQDEADSLILANRKKTNDMYLKRRANGRKYEKIYRELAKKYNLKVRNYRWTQQNRIEYNVEQILSLEEKYKNGNYKDITLEKFVRLSLGGNHSYIWD